MKDFFSKSYSELPYDIYEFQRSQNAEFTIIRRSHVEFDEYPMSRSSVDHRAVTQRFN